ncbi:MAG: Na/Pi cotransporter family protein [Lachnospiraceae bacterium]|nr:Na/Pi cotransporter family protein [Lachnospiraceae bacterium]
MTLFELFSLFGGIGLFLYGMMIMSQGLRNACGDRLKTLLEKATGNRVTGVLAGAGVTVLVQSSSATDVMVIGFVTSGLMTLNQAIGVIMGANIGTTVTAQITAFNISAYAPLILFVGAVMNLFAKNKTVRYVGAVILGFGMLFQGIAFMKGAISPLAQSEQFVKFISDLSNPFLTVILGVLITALLQSSSSATVIFQAFAIEGIISYQIAVYLIIGAAIGSVAPNLLASLTANRAGKRTALLNLIFNLFRAAIVLTLIGIFPQILDFLQSLSPGNVGRQIANTHTIFAVAAVLIMLPFAGLIVKLTEKILPPSAEEARYAEEHRLVYLTQTERLPSAIALDLAHREIARMGKLAVDNLDNALKSFFNKDGALRKQVEATEDTVDYLAEAIVDKLVTLRSLDLTPRNLTRLYRMIKCVDDMERISDHAQNIVEYEERLQEGSAKISEEGVKELKQLAEVTMKSMQTSLKIFTDENFELMEEALRLEDRVDQLKEEIEQNHVVRLAKEACDPRGGIIFTDICTDLERCSDHAVNLAEALRESAA